jgi:hypothetical protein
LLTNLFAALEPLGLTQAIRLVTGSVAVGLVLIILPGDALTGALFLLQRAMILVLLWPRVPTQLLASSAVASLAVGLIYSATVLSLHLSGRSKVRPQSNLLGHLPFRVVAAALGLLLASAAAHAFTTTSLPELMIWMVAWLLVQSVFSLLLATSSLQTGIGVLAFADAGRIVYSLLQPDPLLWGVWAACDVLIALGVASLRSHNTQDAPAASTSPVPEVQQDLPTAGQPR